MQKSEICSERRYNKQGLFNAALRTFLMLRNTTKFAYRVVSNRTLTFIVELIFLHNRFDSTRFQEYRARLRGCHPKQYNKITFKGKMDKCVYIYFPLPFLCWFLNVCKLLLKRSYASPTKRNNEDFSFYISLRLDLSNEMPFLQFLIPSSSLPGFPSLPSSWPQIQKASSPVSTLRHLYLYHHRRLGVSQRPGSSGFYQTRKCNKLQHQSLSGKTEKFLKMQMSLYYTPPRQVQ